VSGNAYARIRRLATHPAFRRDGMLHCPRGCESFATVPEYTKHALSHDLTSKEAWEWLSGKVYNKYWEKRGWLSPEQHDAMRKAVEKQRAELRAALGAPDAGDRVTR
jgi:hypothetical protein